MQNVTNLVTDVVVVGGGPAGCAAAIWCALGGSRVILLEAQSSPRHKAGESLHPGVLTILRQLGVHREVEEAGFLRYPGQMVAWGGNPEFQAFGSDAEGSWLGFQAIRERFDDILLRRAKALGVTVLQPCSAKSLLMLDERVIGVDSSKGLIQSSFVIDATGTRHWLGKKIGSSVYSASQRLIAYYGYMKSAYLVSELLPYLTADSTSWTWVAPISEYSYAWVRLPFSQVQTHPPAPPLLRGCIPIGLTRGADVSWRFLLKAAGAGYFIVGDAVAVLDPLSSHGVLRALMSGMQAAHLLNLVLRRGIDELSAIQAYQEWCLQLFEREVSNMQELYARLPLGSQSSIFPSKLAVPSAL